MTDLSPRQRDILGKISAFIAEHGYPPTNRELATAMGYRSTNAIAEQLDAIERKGFISRAPGKARGLRVLQ